MKFKDKMRVTAEVLEYIAKFHPDLEPRGDVASNKLPEITWHGKAYVKLTFDSSGFTVSKITYDREVVASGKMKTQEEACLLIHKLISGYPVREWHCTAKHNFINRRYYISHNDLRSLDTDPICNCGREMTFSYSPEKPN